MLSKRLFLAVILLFTAQLFAKNTDVMVQNALKKFQKEINDRNFPISKVAVYHISSNSPKIDTLSIQDQITDMLVKSGKFRVIDRQSLNALLKEQSLSLTGMVDNAAMVKAGKLIGVEGFFFGNINVGNDQVVFTIKLIDVESSALLYSNAIIGEDYSSVELGIAVGYGTGYSYNAVFEYNYYTNAPVTEVVSDKATDSPQFTLIYVQGFKNSKNFKFGLNICYAPETDDIIKIKKELTYSNNNVDPPENDQISAKTDPYLTFLSFDPYAVIMPGVFGLDTDIFSFTLGASLHFYFHNTYAEAYSNAGKAYTHRGFYTKINISPTFGIILKPVKFLHLYANALYLMNDVHFIDEIKYEGNNLTHIIKDPYFGKGLIFNIGLGFSYTF